MLWRPISVALSIGVAVAVTGVPVPARGNPAKQQCVDDNASAQELRRQGHFADAGDRLERCAAPSCPKIVRDDCTRRLDDLRLAQPSLVFEVRSPTAKDIIAVRVSLDGQLFTDHLDGTPLKVDPGPHTFTFEVPNLPAVAERLLVREGELGRHVRVVVGSVPPPAMAATAPHQTEVPLTPAVQDGGSGMRRAVGLSAAGLGVVGAVIGAVFGVKAQSAWNQAKKACGGDPNRCVDASSASSHRSQALSAGTVSTGAFVSGAALIAGGALLYFTGGHRDERKTGGVAVSTTVTSGQVGIALLGLF